MTENEFITLVGSLTDVLALLGSVVIAALLILLVMQFLEKKKGR